MYVYDVAREREREYIQLQEDCNVYIYLYIIIKVCKKVVEMKLRSAHDLT